MYLVIHFCFWVSQNNDLVKYCEICSEFPLVLLPILTLSNPKNDSFPKVTVLIPRCIIPLQLIIILITILNLDVLELKNSLCTYRSVPLQLFQSTFFKIVHTHNVLNILRYYRHNIIYDCMTLLFFFFPHVPSL